MICKTLFRFLEDVGYQIADSSCGPGCVEINYRFYSHTSRKMLYGNFISVSLINTTVLLWIYGDKVDCELPEPSTKFDKTFDLCEPNSLQDIVDHLEKIKCSQKNN